MMSPEAFFTNTEIKRCGRGDELKKIDLRLRQATPLDADNRKAGNQLIALLSALNLWLAAKAEKHGEAPSENVIARRKIVGQLHVEVLQELKARFPDDGGEEAALAIAKRSASYARHKADGAAKGLKSLEDGYSNERASFLSKKPGFAKHDLTAEPSGSFVKSTMDARESAGFNAMASPELKELIGRKKFSKLKLDEFVELWQTIDKEKAGAIGNEAHVHLLRKNERISRFLTWAERGLFYKQPGVPYTTPNDSPDLYAMDRYGNLITISAKLYLDLNSGNFTTQARALMAQHNHSSLNAGADVICAGMIAFAQGRITYIDNCSGHYKPTPRHVQNCVRSLRVADSADMSQLTIRVGEPMKNGDVRWSTFNDAGVFLNQKY